MTTVVININDWIISMTCWSTYPTMKYQKSEIPHSTKGSSNGDNIGSANKSWDTASMQSGITGDAG